VPIHPQDPAKLFDVAHIFAGGRVVYTSDQHFGIGSNLILPGRGKNMGDGWETKRNRQPNHKDWAIIKLGSPTFISHVVVDTAHFKGNFPQHCDIHAISSPLDIPPHAPFYLPPPSSNPASESEAPVSEKDEWSLILSHVNLGPHREHFFHVENANEKKFTHVRVTIYPDGGIKRLRVFGSKEQTSDPADSTVSASQSTPAEVKFPVITSMKSLSKHILALPITPEAFAPFGQVIQSYPDVNAIPTPRLIKVTPANFGTALKYHKLSLLENSYPSDAGATSGISVYRCERTPNDSEVEIKALERHPHTNQAFLPLGTDDHKRYIVVVGKNGSNDRPELQTLRAFIVRGDQGVVYNTAVWHLPMTVLDGPMDLACVETQIGDGSAADCEIVELGEEDRVIVRVPA